MNRTLRVAAVDVGLGGKCACRCCPGKDRSPRKSCYSITRAKYSHRPERPYANRSISASASAILGISGVGAKPSSAGVRTACAAAGRPVD